ncbi:uncharacterized protein LOC135153870 [Lytechinus pictus]|uniref:uncharacterized protein LOC135153870 n=1 Tax=Lytechinus pictus TaxID=7653 RepID=UPI0030B9E8DD
MELLQVPVDFLFNINTLILVMTTISLAQGDSKTLKLLEGDKAEMDFPYPCSNSKVTLRMGNQTPYYNSILGTASLPMRYSVQEQNATGNGSCSLHVMINPVSRNDEGACILNVYQGDDVLKEYTKSIDLQVDFPPGKASCKLSQEYKLGDWVSLHCTAPVGTLPGEIKCFQSGMRIPPVGTPFQTNQVLEQTFWVVKRSHPTFCCTSTQEEPVDMCECKDSVWEPSNAEQSNNTKDPCPKIYTVPSSSPISNNSTMEAIAYTQAMHSSKKSYILTIVCMFLPVIVIVLVFVVISGVIVYKSKRQNWKINQLKKKKSSVSQDKVVYMKVPTA